MAVDVFQPPPKSGPVVREAPERRNFIQRGTVTLELHEDPPHKGLRHAGGQRLCVGMNESEEVVSVVEVEAGPRRHTSRGAMPARIAEIVRYRRAMALRRPFVEEASLQFRNLLLRE